jgi:hypothetical protein
MATKLGLVELHLKLEEIAADEADHARELRRILKWTISSTRFCCFCSKKTNLRGRW